MSRFSQVKFRALTKKNDDYEEIKEEQKGLKLKDAADRDVSVGSKVMLPNPKEEGLVVHIDDENVIVRMAPPHRMGPASEVTCVRKCGRKPKAVKAEPKPKVRFAETAKASARKTARKSRRKNNNNNNNADKLDFVLKALALHEASKSRAKSRAKSSAKSRAPSKTARKSRRNNDDD